MAEVLQQRIGTASEWTAANPILAQGEMGIESDTRKFKFGDGSSSWSALSYASSGSGGGNTTTFSTTAPVSPAVGDIWVDSNTGIELTYINDGNTSQWVELGIASSIPSANYSSGKNVILNGDFNIWQRGTSLASGAYTADRWVQTGTGTSSRQSFTLGSAPISGYESPYYYNWTITSNQINSELIQRVEDVRTFAGQIVTLSFWARSTAGAQVVNTGLYQHFGTGGTPSATVAGTAVPGVSYTWTPTSTWQRYVFQISLPSIAGKTLGTNNDHYLWVRVFQLSQTTTNTSIDIWGVQLESGSVATTFSKNSPNPQAELAACQRYYQKLFNEFDGVNFSNQFSTGYIVSSQAVNFGITFPVKMRSVPTMSGYSDIVVQKPGTGSYTITAMTATCTTTNASLATTTLSAVISGATAAQAIVVRTNSSTSYMAFDSEL